VVAVLDDVVETGFCDELLVDSFEHAGKMEAVKINNPAATKFGRFI